MHRDVRRTAENIANSAAAQARVSITKTYDVTVNDQALTKRMVPVLMRAADDNVAQAPLAGASEDFSYFAQEAPGLYVFLGVTPRDQDPAKAAPNHNPRFFVDESALVVGTRTLAFLAVNFLEADTKKDLERKQARPFIQDAP
jgi:metal-dependent amidase/aminoacylase/carboxypeptidase family protein